MFVDFLRMIRSTLFHGWVANDRMRRSITHFWARAECNPSELIEHVSVTRSGGYIYRHLSVVRLVASKQFIAKVLLTLSEVRGGSVCFVFLPSTVWILLFTLDLVLIDYDD